VIEDDDDVMVMMLMIKMMIMMMMIDRRCGAGNVRSFGKLLEVFFYNRTAMSRAATCRHSLQRDQVTGSSARGDAFFGGAQSCCASIHWVCDPFAMITFSLPGFRMSDKRGREM
jgi:hypothetical protein